MLFYQNVPNSRQADYYSYFSLNNRSIAFNLKSQPAILRVRIVVMEMLSIYSLLLYGNRLYC